MDRKPGMLRATTRGALLMGCAAALAACQTPTPAPRASAAQAAAQHAHADDIESLRTVMRRMDELIYDRMQTELELDKRRLERADELAQAAARLAANARRLVPSTADTADQRERFVANANGLAAEAAELARIAREGRFAELSPQIERVSHRCAGCHVDFRARGEG